MHTYVHVCTRAYIHTYIHTYMHTYIQTYKHTNMLVTCGYYGLSPPGTFAPRGSRALGARAHVDRNDLHFCGWHFGQCVLMLLVSRRFESSRWTCLCDFFLLCRFPYRGRCPQRVQDSGGKDTCRKKWLTFWQRTFWSMRYGILCVSTRRLPYLHDLFAK